MTLPTVPAETSPWVQAIYAFLKPTPAVQVGSCSDGVAVLVGAGYP